MPNIKLTLSWNGAKFNGYQSQPDGCTVQDTLNAAWKIFAKESVTLIGCSRLDSQVHAHHFVLNFLTETEFECEKIIRALNGILHTHFKADICVYDCEYVASDFHARYHALGKHYRYLIWSGHKTHALLTPQCWSIHSKNKIENLNSYLQQFVGEHDFAGFRASDCSAKNTIKNIQAVTLTQHALFPEMQIIDFCGDGFLKNMIRNMVGTAVQMSLGKLESNCIQNAFEHKNRERVGMCAPGSALTLMRVYYNKEELSRDSQGVSQTI